MALVCVLITPFLLHLSPMVERKGAAGSTDALKEKLLIVFTTTAGKVLMLLLTLCTVDLLLYYCTAIDSSLLPESNLNAMLIT